MATKTALYQSIGDQLTHWEVDVEAATLTPRGMVLWLAGLSLIAALMLAPLIGAETIPETLAHVMTRPVDLTTLPETTPANEAVETAHLLQHRQAYQGLHPAHESTTMVNGVLVIQGERGQGLDDRCRKRCVHDEPPVTSEVSLDSVNRVRSREYPRRSPANF